MTRRECPGDSRLVVGEGACHDIGVSAAQHGAHPVCHWAGVFVHLTHKGARTLYEQPSNVFVATLADAEQVGLAAGAVLARHESDRCGEVAAASVLFAISHLRREHAER